jgi:hypothetical protein
MKNRILAKFQGQDFPSYNTEVIYIMDYTNQTENVRGIEWNDTVPIDIDAFVINNSSLLDITFCAFKDNTIKIKEKTKEFSHCEGVLFPTVNSNETWITFLELKYPQKKENLGSNLKEAREQLLLTLDLFREQGIIEEKRLVYLIFSAPKYKTPFKNWTMQARELRELQKTKYAIMRGVNNIQVISNEKIKV